MPRKPRFAPPGYYLHITQRGNYRQRTFFSDRDYLEFLSLLALHADHRQVDILAYSIMSNHFHLIARTQQPGGISCFMQGLNGQYAQLLHGRLRRRGRLWQERFYSCVLSNTHLVAALRYVELNPVRAGIVPCATHHRWSSAAIHAGQQDEPPEWLDLHTFRDLYAHPADWESLLQSSQPREERAAIRRATQWEIPLGPQGFVEQLEAQFQVKLLPRPPGRRPGRPGVEPPRMPAARATESPDGSKLAASSA